LGPEKGLRPEGPGNRDQSPRYPAEGREKVPEKRRKKRRKRPKKGLRARRAQRADRGP